MSSEDLSLSPDFLRKLEFLRLATRKPLPGRSAALQRSSRLGRGMDFADHRAYSPGDDYSDIDWNLYGRLDRLMVRLAEEERDLNLHVLVDCSRSMASGGKAEYVRQIVTALAYITLARLDRIHVYPFAATLGHPLSPSRSKAGALRVHRHLTTWPVDGETDLGAAARSFSEVARVRGVVLVLSDFLAPGGWQRGVQLLRHARHEVALFQVTSPEEERVEARGEVVLRDAETGRQRRVRITEAVARAYREAFVAHSEELQTFSRANRLTYIHASTGTPLEDLILGSLRTERFLVG